MFVPLTRRMPYVALAAALCCCGCGETLDDLKGKIADAGDQAIDAAKEAADAAAEQAKEAAGLAGSMELQVDGPVSLDTCRVALHTFSDGRSPVLSIKSYESYDKQSYPSVFMQGVTDADTPSGLAGKTIQVEAYVAAGENGPLWRAAADAPLEIRVTSVADGEIHGEIASGTFVEVASGKQAAASGSFRGLLPE